MVSLEKAATEEDLSGTEFFFFTDNDVSEGAIHKGTSSSPLLFELILRLKTLELSSETKFNFVHVAGTRMIQQGTDGLSRGNMFEGVMTGQRLLSFVPLHLGAVQQ